MNRQAFIAELAPIAIQAWLEGSPMFPSVRLAQNILETGGVIHPWHNLGGIKVGNGQTNEWWTGRIVRKETWEEYDGTRVNMSADFRAYDSVYHFYKDQDLLLQHSRYERVRQAAAPEEQANMLQASGYATDSQYARKLIDLIHAHGLKRYDEEAVRVYQELLSKVNSQQQAIDALQRRVAVLDTRVDPPDWFVQEFGSANLGGLIHEPQFSPEGWRVLAVALRALRRQAG